MNTKFLTSRDTVRVLMDATVTVIRVRVYTSTFRSASASLTITE